MIRTVWIALAACLLTTHPASAQAAPADARHQIEPLLDEMMAAANAHDTDRFMKVYLHQPSLVFVFNGTIFRGFDALHEQQLKWWNNGASDVAYTQRGAPVISVLEPGVAVVMMALASRRAMPDGTVQSGDFAVTMTWQKRPEGWRIVQAHESTVR